MVDAAPQSTNRQSAILLVGHGSRDSDGTEEFRQLVEEFRLAEPGRIVELSFLEFASPGIGEGVAACIRRGARTLTVLPGMLMAAGHVKNDIPSAIHEAQQRYPGVKFHYGRHLHLHAKIIELSQLRLVEAENQARTHNGRPHDRRDTLLLVVGRGSNDPDANADVLKLTRLLWERMGYGWATACYSGVTTPLLAEALEGCRHMGFGRILVFPFFLFTGVLEKRVRKTAHAFGRKHPEFEVLCARCLGVHPLLADVFRERAEEAPRGSPNMNCEIDAESTYGELEGSQ